MIEENKSSRIRKKKSENQERDKEKHTGEMESLRNPNIVFFFNFLMLVAIFFFHKAYIPKVKKGQNHILYKKHHFSF